MGRPVESPWTVQWYTGNDLQARLCHMGQLVLIAKPPEMFVALHGSPIMTSDLEHLLRWASFICSQASSIYGYQGPLDVAQRVDHLRDEIRINSFPGHEMTYHHVSHLPLPDMLQLLPGVMHHHLLLDFLQEIN